MGETYQEGSGAGADFDLSQFYQIFFEEAGENLDQMEQMLLDLDVDAANDAAGRMLNLLGEALDHDRAPRQHGAGDFDQCRRAPQAEHGDGAGEQAGAKRRGDAVGIGGGRAA